MLSKRRSTIDRNMPLPPRSRPMKPRTEAVKHSRKRIRAVGRKGRENARALRIFKREMARLGLDRCEVRFEGCTGDYNLTWAHGRKRRLLRPGELESFAVISCAVCHATLDERMNHAEMAAKVAEIIALRPVRLAQQEAA